MVHTVKGFCIVNEAEIDVSLKFSCFIYDPMDVGNLILGFIAFSKSSLNICKFLDHVMLRPGLENFEHYFASFGASLIAQLVKNLPAMLETWVRSLDWEDPLEEGIATHSSILAWRIPWTEEPGRLQSLGLKRVGHA